MATISQYLFDKLPVSMVKAVLNMWPPFWGTGISIKKISPDYRSIEVIMKLTWYNKNYMGVHFGGSLFSMTDPFPMLMLVRNLGDNYIVWDKAACIEFKKPGRGTVYANFSFSEAQIQSIRTATATEEKYFYDCEINVVDAKGEIIATIVKTLYIRKK
jgi:acyl-coenzyme A thioesterase PaaI-like protein